MPGIIRPLHTLWNEVVGFVFLVLAIMPVPSIVRSIRDPDADGAVARLIVASLFALAMAYFGVSSFLKARKISRS